MMIMLMMTMTMAMARVRMSSKGTFQSPGALAGCDGC